MNKLKHKQPNYRYGLNKKTRYIMKQGAVILLSICLIGGYVRSRTNNQSFITSNHLEANAWDEHISEHSSTLDNDGLGGEGDQVKEEVGAIQVTVPTPTPTTPSSPTTQRQIAKITAYSCGGLTTNAEIDMNCPSIKSGGPRTASGTTPVPFYTAACDPANMGRKFIIEGLGEIRCEDTGGAIKGAGRFDIYLPTIEEARSWGVKYLEYQLVKN